MFFHAWTGYLEARKQDYAVLFEMLRFNALYTAFSGDQAKAIHKTKNPYTDRSREKGKPVMMNEISGLLSAMAKVSK